MDTIYGLVGVFVGFLVSAGWTEYKDWRCRSKLKKGLMQELRTNLYMIPQKRDILKQILNALAQGQLLHGEGVHFQKKLYLEKYKILMNELTQIERNSLHYIYESFRILDSEMAEYANNIMDNVDSQHIQKFIKRYSLQFKDLLENLNDVENSIKKHLQGNPIDVFHINKNYEEVKNAKFEKP
jgi:hypothetical protein